MLFSAERELSSVDFISDENILPGVKGKSRHLKESKIVTFAPSRFILKEWLKKFP